MRKTLLGLGCAGLMIPSVSLAELGMSAGAAINFKTGEYIPRLDADTGFKFTNTTLDLMLTLFTERFFLTLNYDAPLKEDYSVLNRGTIEVEMTRLDEGITFGYDVYRGLNLFLGYKIGETEGKSVRTTGTSAGTVNFLDKGPFAGLSYGYNFGALGTFSASVAYASFNGKITNINEITNATQSTSGSTTGLSYGIKWSKGLQTGAQFSIGFKQNLYEFVDKDLTLGNSNDLKQDFDIFYVQVASEFK